MNAELVAPGTEKSRRDALLALLAEANTSFARPVKSSARAPPASSTIFPLQIPLAPSPPPFPQVVFGAEDNVGNPSRAQKRVSYRSHSGGKKSRQGHIRRHTEQKQQQQQGINVWAEGKAAPKAQINDKISARTKERSLQASSGFPEMSPIAQARCLLPFDVSGSNGSFSAGGQEPPPLTVDMIKRASQVGCQRALTCTYIISLLYHDGMSFICS